jgi:hypothetical protein
MLPPLPMPLRSLRSKPWALLLPRLLTELPSKLLLLCLDEPSREPCSEEEEEGRRGL